MTMRAVHSAVAIAAVLAVLSACAPEIPDSGIGFDTSADAQRALELRQSGAGAGTQPFVPPAAVSDETLPPAVGAPLAGTSIPAADAAPGSADIAAEAAAALAGTSTGSAPAPASVPVATASSAAVGAGISDENNFNAVASRQTIESDAARIEQNRAQYEVIAPTALPSRSSETQPNIVSYALATSHPQGTRLYSRSGINLDARARRNCSAYPSPDQAQIEFLSKGGPERDRLALDPDGDGYACSWDPAPFRRAVQN
jgi:hypothetical protein